MVFILGFAFHLGLSAHAVLTDIYAWINRNHNDQTLHITENTEKEKNIELSKRKRMNENIINPRHMGNIQTIFIQDFWENNNFLNKC